MILKMFYVDLVYKTCIESEKKTCAGKYELAGKRIKAKSYPECKNHCNKHTNCKYIYYRPSNSIDNCILYSSCDELRNPLYTISTYSKEGKCPGNSYFFIFCLKILIL